MFTLVSYKLLLLCSEKSEKVFSSNCKYVTLISFPFSRWQPSFHPWLQVPYAS